MTTETKSTGTPTTEDVIAGMLGENTGRHMLDSGGAYGRNWERNQGHTFADDAPATFSTDWGYLDVTLSLYHFLVDRLEYDHELQESFDRFAARPENESEGWLTLMESFLPYAESRLGLDIGGLYGESGHGFTVNTYNHESLLSQIIQYRYFTVDREAFALLQIHGGCDARGGYTAPKVFRVADYDGTSLLDDGRATIYCDGGKVPNLCDGQLDMDGAEADTRCGAHWDLHGGDVECGERYVAGGGYDSYPDIGAMEIVKADEPEVGQITTLPDGRSICPCCGNGELKAAPWPEG